MLRVKKTFISCYIKNILLFKNMKIRQKKSEYQYLYKKNQEITNDPEGIDIVYGEDFLNCKIIHSKLQN